MGGGRCFFSKIVFDQKKCCPSPGYVSWDDPEEEATELGTQTPYFL